MWETAHPLECEVTGCGGAGGGSRSRSQSPSNTRRIQTLSTIQHQLPVSDAAHTRHTQKAMDLDAKLSGLVASDLTPKISVRELTDPRGFEVEKLRRVQTKFGPALIANITVANEKKTVFLPARFNASLSDGDVEVINDAVPKYRITCSNPIPKSPEVKLFQQN